MIGIAEFTRERRIFGDIFHLAIDSFRANRSRFLLTSLGMVLGTGSLIWVVTIGLAGEKYVLTSIQNIGANLIWAECPGLDNPAVGTEHDFLTVRDMEAVQREVPGVMSATPVVNLREPYPTGSGGEISLLELGVYPQYEQIRRLRLLSGRFFDEHDAQLASKAAVVTEKFAVSQYGSVRDALGHNISLSGIPFEIIGTFVERMNTYGGSEIADNTVLIPYQVARYIKGNDVINQIYFSASDMNNVPQATEDILRVIKSRHRPEAVYDVGNLTDVLEIARKTMIALNLILLLFSAVTLLVGGIGIMNIMLATVTSRIREIGIRKALGATRSEIRLQFLLESTLISVGGGVIGTIVGFLVPFTIHLFSGFELQFSWVSAVVALLVSGAIGIAFGTTPATRAALLDPVECLRSEF
ncbi:MAG TPA: ABC transporter permease [Alloacidobacterium sp.]|jgi:putative ABC transport system permease protein|nr:ABC transporter permease [Alloacidobacterium sp.]